MSDSFVNKNPLLSICIPTYNRNDCLIIGLSKLIPQIEQVSNYVELIITDNCSTDSSFDTIKAIKKEYNFLNIIINRNDNNLGFYGNFLKCRELSSGEFIWILSDNDHIENDNLLRNIIDIILHNQANIIYLDNTFDILKPLSVRSLVVERLISEYGCYLTLISAVIFKNIKTGDTIINEKFKENAFLGFLYLIDSIEWGSFVYIIKGYCYSEFLQRQGNFDYFEIFVNHQLNALSFMRSKGASQYLLKKYKNHMINHHVKRQFIKYKIDKSIHCSVKSNKNILELIFLFAFNFSTLKNYWKYLFPISITPPFLLRQFIKMKLIKSVEV
jgi:glycosyltransferase involved in cell wall biosynthesis